VTIRLGQLFLTLPFVIIIGASMDAQADAGTSGIEIIATISPIHGGPSKLGEADSAPLANTSFRVEAAGKVVRTFKTDAKGYFKVDLPPGRYEIRIEKPIMKGPGCGLGDVEVTAGVFKKVNLDCDSGMR